MCGIAGVVGAADRPKEAWLSLAGAMADTLTHRGPDDSGAWADAAAGVALGHRRLAILDLTPAGHQPMVSSCGRVVVVFNGEIYNHHDLADELAGCGRHVKGRSDTEVLVEAIAQWGSSAALRRCNGMFAVAAWDAAAGRLTLARDRMGEKPLYYGRAGRDLVFGSELKALRAHPDLSREVDRTALTLYFRYRYVPAPRTILRDVAKLEPGHCVELYTADGDWGPAVPFWSPTSAAADGVARRLVAPEQDLEEMADARLREAVGLRLESDVSLGAFLSGGIDSTVVTALMQAVSPGAVRTFTIGYDDPAWDESHHAARIAAHLGTDHTEMRVTPGDALDVVPSLADVYDEPFGDSSAVPTILVSRLTRRHVTVALSGDGGDELFGGYNRYVWAPRLLATASRLPPRARRTLARALSHRSPAQWDATYSRVETVLPHRFRQRMPGDKIAKLASALQAGDATELYTDLVSHWKRPVELVTGGDDPRVLAAHALPAAGVVDDMTLLDMTTYLPGDILTKVDRASMAASLEARAPFLDHGLVEWSWTLPPAAKVRDGRGKWLLRRVLERYVPREMWDRPKMGFGIPIGDWLRDPLRDWCEDLLDPARMRSEGYLEPDVVASVWDAHRSRRANRQYELWDVLMFQAWLRRWG